MKILGAVTAALLFPAAVALLIVTEGISGPISAAMIAVSAIVVSNVILERLLS